MKRDIGFRFSGEFHEVLLALSERWGCTRTETVERAVSSAALGAGFSGSPIVAKVLPNDPKEVERIVESLPEKPKAVDTRTQAERTDDFYRRNMAGKGKK